jgi:hypothetical protein
MGVEILKGKAFEDASVVDEDVDGAKSLFNAGDYTGDRCCAGDVALYRHGAATLADDLLHNKTGIVPGVQVVYRHSAPCLGELDCDGTADSARSPGDKSSFSAEWFHIRSCLGLMSLNTLLKRVCLTIFATRC